MAKGFLDRLGSAKERLEDVVGGVAGAGDAVLDLAWDLAKAPFVDDEYGGALDTIYSATVNRGGQFLENLLGPQEGLGAAIGGTPEALRRPVAAVMDPLLEGAEDVYREGIAEPLSTTFILNRESGLPVPNLGAAPAIFKAVTDPGSIGDAYAQAQHTSPGQAAALEILAPGRVLNDDELAEIAGTDEYEAISGTADAVLRLFGDPTVVGGKVATSLRVGKITKPIRTADDINRAMGSGRIDKFRSAVMGKSAAQIRDEFFPHHVQGAQIAAALADAGDDVDTFNKTLRAAMGDKAAQAELWEKRADIAGQVERATAAEREILALHRSDTLFADPERVTKARAELDAYVSEADRAHRATLAFNALREVPRVSMGGRARVAVAHSTFYQKSALAAPVRSYFNFVPHRWINLHDGGGDIQLDRMLRQAGFDVDQRDQWRSAYMQAFTPTDRLRVLEEAEDFAVSTLAKDAGITTDELQALISRTRSARANARQTLVKSRIYDGEGRGKIVKQTDDGIWEEVHLPLWVTQEQNFHPLVNMAEAKRALSPIREFRAKFPGEGVPTELAERFMRVWKPSVLLRVGWPLRVAAIDEQLRIMSKVGALTQVNELGAALRRNLTERVRGVPKDQRGLGKKFSVNGVDFAPVYGTPDDVQDLLRQNASAASAFREVVGTAERDALKKLQDSTGEWRSILPEEEGYATAWEQAVNLQIAKDAAGQKFLKGATADEVETWLTTTEEGQQYASRIAGWRGHEAEWVAEMESQVNAYLPTPSLRALALDGKATAADLAREIGDARQRPVVHGQMFRALTGDDKLAKAWAKTVDGLFDWLGTKPTDVLSRNRFIDHIYRAEVNRMVRLFDDVQDGLNADDIIAIQDQARTVALGETKRYLYDLRESSEMAEALRFISPFFSAWQEGVGIYAGIAIENPAFVARVRQVWNAPEKLGLVHDESGNIVHEDGTATNVLGEKVEPGEERYVLLSVPEFVTDIPGMRVLEDRDVKFSKSAFNMVLQGPPGFGPLVQVPVNQVVKDRPELEDSLAFVLPFGTTQDTQSLLLPATAKRLRSRFEGEADSVYFNTAMRMHFEAVTDYNLGKREEPPTWAESKKKADSFFNLRAVASWISPAAPQFTSPYQPYIDALRALKERDPATADQKFLEMYGEEYFALTQSLSQSMDGIPPSVEGFVARKKYKGLVEAAPELGAWIVGAEGAGEFSRAVYDYQRSHVIREGSDVLQREKPSFEEAAAGPNRRLGWRKYRQAMDVIEAERVRRGLPSLQVAGARDMRELKARVVDKLSQDYPEWFAEFAVVDRQAVNRRLTAMRAIAEDDQVSGRPEMQATLEYFRARDAFVSELQRRKAAGGSATLNAMSNADVAATWAAFTSALVERSPAFSDTFFRYLENDPLEQLA